MTDRPSARMKQRLNIWLSLPVAAILIYTVATIFSVSIKDGKRWQSLANAQQLKSTAVSASRGTIYDSNGTVLSQSATVYTVYADPLMLKEKLDDNDKKIEELKGYIAKEDDASKKATYQQRLDATKSGDECLDELVEFLALNLEIDTNTVREKLTKTDTQYIVLKKEVEKTVSTAIEDKLTELGIDGVRCDPTTRRLYPQNTLASVVLGHTDYEGNGIYGLEAYYDDYLSGIDGRIITAKASDGTEIPYRYKQSYDAQDGDDLNLNIDANIQYILEKELAKAVEENQPTDRACGIIMNPKTGQIYAMATSDPYDPNEPAAISDEKTAAELAGLSGSETVLDMYCGAGTVGISLSDKCKSLCGIEIVPQAVENAIENARLNNLSNAEFICADAYEGAKILTQKGVRPDVVILDPPRKGCQREIFDIIAGLGVKKIVYISCNSATLARDLQILSQAGYNAKRLKAVDLFPRTPHIECVALIEK